MTINVFKLNDTTTAPATSEFPQREALNRSGLCSTQSLSFRYGRSTGI